MKIVSISFPQKVLVKDYHELNQYKEVLAKFGIKVQYIEAGWEYDGQSNQSGYVGFFYIGSINDPSNRELLSRMENPTLEKH